MIAIYARVSTEEQAKKGFSLQDQIKECKKKAETSKTIEYIDEGISGEFLDRPALSRLRQDVKDGIVDRVICLDPDRLSRKLVNQLIISEEIEKKAQLIFVNGEYQRTPEGMLFYQMRGAIAEFEKAKINERMSRGRREKARQGKVIRDYQIYGYDYDKKKQNFVINEKEAAVVKLIFELMIKPNDRVQGINGIAKYLTKMKYPTKKGKSVWHRQVVRQMLMNEAYTGTFYQNRWNAEGMLGNKHRPKCERVVMTERPREEWIEVDIPPIIDKETFNHAQAILKESRRRWAKKGIRQYLLSGLLRCGQCGNTMVGMRTKNWGSYVLYYSDRKNYAGAKHSGCGLQVKVEQLDEEIWRKIVSWLDNPSEIAAVSEVLKTQSQPLEEAEFERLMEELDRARNGRRRLLSLFAQGLEIAEEEISEQIIELKQKEEQILKQLEELQFILDMNKAQEKNEELLEAVCFYLSAKGERELTFDDKQEIIRHIVKEIRVFDDRVDIFIF